LFPDVVTISVQGPGGTSAASTKRQAVSATTLRFELAKWQRDIKRIFIGFELGWPIAIPMLWIINAAEAQLPLVIPIANIIWDKVVVGVRGSCRDWPVLADHPIMSKFCLRQ